MCDRCALSVVSRYVTSPQTNFYSCCDTEGAHSICHNHTFPLHSCRFCIEETSVPCHSSANWILRDVNPLLSARRIKASHVSIVVYSPHPIQACPARASNFAIESTRTPCSVVYHNKSAKNKRSNPSAYLENC